jgi:hypothetical protein
MPSAYRQLDSMTEGPDVMGPTRDHHAQALSDVTYQQQWSYNMRPGPRMPVTLATKSRPKTVPSPMTQLNPGRLPVLIRNSNVSPQGAGQGDGHSSWTVSDPYYAHTDAGAAVAGMGAAADGSVPAPMPAAAPASSHLTPKVIAIGAVLGLGAWLFMKHRRG